MKKYTKRLLAFLLALVMVVTGVPMSAKEAKAADINPSTKQTTLMYLLEIINTPTKNTVANKNEYFTNLFFVFCMCKKCRKPR